MNLNRIHKKIVSQSEIVSKANSWRKRGEAIVFTNGCFDLLHRGHVEYLAKAADLGERLIIGLNTDNSVKRQGKGELRPIKDEQTRAMVLAAFQFVSAVVLFDDDTPYELIASILPDVLVKGGDWKLDQIVGADIVEANGGQVRTIPFVDGYSTTNYVKKILDGKN